MPNKRLKITPIVRIRRKAQVTIPAQILKALHLEEGAYLQLSVQEGRIILEPIELNDKISGKDFLAAMSNVVKAVERSTSTSRRRGAS